MRLYVVDEKVPSPHRTQRLLPPCLGFFKAFTHIRNDTTTAFAALDAATAKVPANWAKRHRHGQYLTLLRLIDRKLPPDSSST